MKYINAYLDHFDKNDNVVKRFARKHAEQIESRLNTRKIYQNETWYKKELKNLNEVKKYI